MKAKRRIALIALTLIVAILAGCGSKTPEAAPGEAKTTAPSASPSAPASSGPENTLEPAVGQPEDVIAEIYNGLVRKSLTWENIWDSYVSDLSKSLGFMTRDQFVDAGRAQEQNNIVYTGYSFVSKEDLGGGIYKINCVISFTSSASDSEAQQTLVEYVTEENGAYKYLISGVTDYKEYSNLSDEAVRLENVAVYTMAESIYITFDVVNKSPASYSLGWVSGANVTLSTGEGEYHLTMNEPLKVPAGATQSCVCNFAGAKGAVRALTMFNVLERSSSGLPLDASATGTSLTASFE